MYGFDGFLAVLGLILCFLRWWLWTRVVFGVEFVCCLSLVRRTMRKLGYGGFIKKTLRVSCLYVSRWLKPTAMVEAMNAADKVLHKEGFP